MARKTASKAPAADVWRRRIVGHGEVLASEIVAHPKNFRLHPETQRAAVSEAITRLGWIEEVLVNRTTGRLLNGHLRVELAAQRGEKVPVSFCELSIDEENLALASFDPLGMMAIEDSEKLSELLAEMNLGSSSPLDIFLATAGQDALLSQLLGTENDGAKLSDGPRLPNIGQTIALVIAMKDLVLVERAIRATNKINRGEAIAEICRSYLDNAEGQLDIPAEETPAFGDVAPN
jgi:hypothetical protein